MKEEDRLRLLVEKIKKENLKVRIIGEGLPLLSEDRTEQHKKYHVQ